jgi:hypothetical protein
MALDQAWASGDAVTKTTAKTFIPEIWSDEIIAEYEHSLVMKPLVKALKMSGKKGDTIHIPKPHRGPAHEKISEKQVTLDANVEEEKVIVIDQHWEKSFLIEDVVNVQALGSLRRFYTSDAGYALAKQVDSDLINSALEGWTVQMDSLGGTPGSSATPHVPGNAKEFCDQAFRDALQVLDDADVPMDSRKLVIPPAARNAIMGIDRYVSSDFVNGRTVNNGYLGDLYGVKIYMSTNLPTNDEGEQPCLLFHTDALVIAEQMGIRSQVQYKQEYLADLLTSDTLYGEDVYREENGVVIWIAK